MNLILLAKDPVTTSQLFESIQGFIKHFNFETVQTFICNFIEHPFLHSNLTRISILILALFWLSCLISFVVSCIDCIKKKFSFSFSLSVILPQFSWLIFFAGIIVYYIGYDYAGTGKNCFTLLFRSILASLEMFISKSGLIGIASNCKNDSTYMFCFIIVHISAILVSMVFVVTCFGKRILDTCRGLAWKFIYSSSTMHVFWGIDERNILLAKDIYAKSNGKERIVFIDLPKDNTENNNAKSFGGLMGLLSYQVNKLKYISDIQYILLRSSIHPSAAIVESKDLFLIMGIKKLKRFIKKVDHVNFYIFSDDENVNLCLALNLLNNEVSDKIQTVFCFKRKTKAAGLLEQCQNYDRLRFIDDSREAIVELSTRMDEKGNYVGQPVNFMRVNKRLGFVEGPEPFTSLIIGFNTTGQEALKFLYEFSAFPNKYGKKVPVNIVVFDSKINSIKGDLFQEIPALADLEKMKEIELFSQNSGTELFYRKLKDIINRLNYVVVATGDDDKNLHIATMIYEFALQYRKNEFNLFKIFVRLYKSENEYKFIKTIETYKLTCKDAIEYFGAPRLIYTKKQIVDNDEVENAQTFCDVYNGIKISRNKDISEAIKERIDKELRNNEIQLLGYRSFDRKFGQDMANSKHIYTKCVLLGLSQFNEMPKLPEWPFSLSLVKDQDTKEWYQRLINASICEHLRWNAAYLMMGYIKMSPDEFKTFNENSGKEKTCDEKRKQHACLVDWNELNKVSSENNDYQMYDYNVVVTTIKIYFKDYKK